MNSAAQDANAGRALYNAILVPGNPNCASGGCHGPNPLDRQNKIQNGDTPGGIGFAISSVRDMAFLKNRLSGAELTNLAAYIANPAAATGSPSISVSRQSIVFPGLTVGLTSVGNVVTVSNSGTAALVVNLVRSDSADFVVSNSNCQSVAPGASCTFSVAFAPQGLGLRSGFVNIAHNATGGTTAIAVSGNALAPILSVSPTEIDFGFVVGDAASPVRSVLVTNSTSVAISLTDVRVTDGSFILSGGSCAVGLTLVAGAGCWAEIKFDAQQAGVRTAELVVASNLAPTLTVSLVGEWIFLPPSYKMVIEYRFTPLDYYFITSSPAEQQLLDGAAGFERTGQRFLVFASDTTPTGGRAALTRFYFDRIARNEARGSHFYTLLDDERSSLRSLNPTNSAAPRLPFDEGTDSWAVLPVVPGVGGSCAAGLTPVYRLFRGNTRFPDDPNHRFTVRADIYNEFVARGWDGEGVRFCVPTN